MFKKSGKYELEREVFKTLTLKQKIFVVYAVVMMNLGLPVWSPAEKAFVRIVEHVIF